MHLSFTIWIHLIGAALLVGGGVVFGAVTVPTLRALPEAQRALYIAKAARRFANVGWIAIVILLLTGLDQLSTLGYPWWAIFKPRVIPGSFGDIFTYKIALFWILVAINVIEEIANKMLRRRERGVETASGDFRQGSLAKIHRARMLLNSGIGAVTVLLALAILYFGTRLAHL